MGCENFEISTVRLRAGCSASELTTHELAPGARIELANTRLTVAAITTLVNPEYLGRLVGIDPTPADSQSTMLPLHHSRHRNLSIFQGPRKGLQEWTLRDI